MCQPSQRRFHNISVWILVVGRSAGNTWYTTGYAGWGWCDGGAAVHPGTKSTARHLDRTKAQISSGV
jgi:hypothetical protein